MAVTVKVFFVLTLLQSSTGQLVNVALNKPASLSSSSSASRGVDGDRDTAFSTAAGRTSAWWSVDLGRPVQNPVVSLYFGNDNFLRRYPIDIYTSANAFTAYPPSQSCFSNPNDGSRGVITTRCPGTWRHLMIYRGSRNTADNSNGVILNFAELEVTGCSENTYSTSCDKNCSSRHCAVTPAPCPSTTGSCPPGGCDVGYTGADCNQDCTGGTYGADCTKSCRSRHCAVPSDTCDSGSGACGDGGCEPGYQDTDCTQVCTAGRYGLNCVHDCSSRQCQSPFSPCPAVDGVCHSGGCQPGWTGSDCAEACSSGRYGDRCEAQCINRNCVTSSGTCDHVSGVCSGGCATGWSGTDCVIECPSGTYGQNCTKSCCSRHCVIPSHTCHHVTGTCGNGGCVGGYQNTDCTQESTQKAGGSKSTISISGLVIGFVTGVILTLAAGGIVLWCLKRKGKFQWNKTKMFTDRDQANHYDMPDIRNAPTEYEKIGPKLYENL